MVASGSWGRCLLPDDGFSKQPTIRRHSSKGGFVSPNKSDVRAQARVRLPITDERMDWLADTRAGKHPARAHFERVGENIFILEHLCIA